MASSAQENEEGLHISAGFSNVVVLKYVTNSGCSCFQDVG
jgi:hypothetical protein